MTIEIIFGVIILFIASATFLEIVGLLVAVSSGWNFRLSFIENLNDLAPIPGLIHGIYWAIVGIRKFYLFAERGFDNTENVVFCVNEQITLGGDASYYITRELYLGKCKRRPICVDYYGNGRFSPYAPTYTFASYENAMEKCIQCRIDYENGLEEKNEMSEENRLSQITITNKYHV